MQFNIAFFSDECFVWGPFAGSETGAYDDKKPNTLQISKSSMSLA